MTKYIKSVHKREGGGEEGIHDCMFLKKARLLYQLRMSLFQTSPNIVFLL